MLNRLPTKMVKSKIHRLPPAKTMKSKIHGLPTKMAKSQIQMNHPLGLCKLDLELVGHPLSRPKKRLSGLPLTRDSAFEHIRDIERGREILIQHSERITNMGSGCGCSHVHRITRVRG